MCLRRLLMLLLLHSKPEEFDNKFRLCPYHVEHCLKHPHTIIEVNVHLLNGNGHAVIRNVLVVQIDSIINIGEPATAKQLLLRKARFIN